ncbi:Peptidoglycan-associated lipoprotein [Methylobacterium cerastii]|uniref:Peptidoglycan-associated lipoprotein n=1 Tax=Methylobacterium cerastii TaxID=932741 RepID=A0ABQ4QK48_9HYPH|nr:OmpA family protein [Methylobacterium cerastii]GJD45630.1 Peptidoglycan-associated lipoprotein [Methylobacterium cerastii]
MERAFSKLAVGLGGLLALAGAAVAEDKPSYHAADIERHFLPDLGPSRALCIGAESECAKGVPNRPKVSSGFDLIVTFDYNSDVLTSSARANLDEFAKALRGAQLGSTAFMVEGHTDSKGGDAFNLDLSARRARSVVSYLSEHGVEADRLEAKAFGKARPRTGNPDDPANRRVEARLRGE